MTRQPRGLDLFARAGGSTAGYIQAGFHMTAVDLLDRSALNPAGKFVVADALEFAAEHGHEFDLIHAGPPCQAKNPLVLGTNGGKGGHVDLLDKTRDVLDWLGVPYVMEQPAGRHSLRRDLMLCGEMFPETRPEWNEHGDLVKYGVQRHRYFEFGGWSVQGPHWVHHCRHGHQGRTRGYRHGPHYDGPYLAFYGEGGGKGTVAEAPDAMGIDWMTDLKDLAEAIPPAYTRWIGEQWLASRERAA